MLHLSLAAAAGFIVNYILASLNFPVIKLHKQNMTFGYFKLEISFNRLIYLLQLFCYL